MSRTAIRLLAIGGVLGPAAFVGAWLAAGATTDGYSPANDAISDLAATSAPTRAAMTFGFIGFGLGVIAFGFALRGAGAGPAWVAAVATACFTLAVAATPLGGPTRDVVHGAFASLGYLTLVAVPFLAGRQLATARQEGWTRASFATAALSGAFLVASAIGPAHGLFQRVGLTLGDVWIVAMALTLVSGRNPFSTGVATRPSR